MSIRGSINMALLTEGEDMSIRGSINCPPDGGRGHVDSRFYKHSLLTEGEDMSIRGSINIALLTEGVHPADVAC